MMIRAIGVAVLAASFAASAADIQKCADASGRITYQDMPCSGATTIATLPRESAQGDPAALQQLERERARLERAADARIAQQTQQEAAPANVPQTQQQPVIVGTVGPDGNPVYYAAPVVGVIPGGGGVIAPGTTTPTQDQQSSSTATQPPPAILQPPVQSPSSITTVPIPSPSSTLAPPQAVMPSPGITQSPAAAAPR